MLTLTLTYYMSFVCIFKTDGKPIPFSRLVLPSSCLVCPSACLADSSVLLGNNYHVVLVCPNENFKQNVNKIIFLGSEN